MIPDPADAGYTTDDKPRKGNRGLTRAWARGEEFLEVSEFEHRTLDRKALRAVSGRRLAADSSCVVERAGGVIGIHRIRHEARERLMAQLGTLAVDPPCGAHSSFLR